MLARGASAVRVLEMDVQLDCTTDHSSTVFIIYLPLLLHIPTSKNIKQDHSTGIWMQLRLRET